MLKCAPIIFYILSCSSSLFAQTNTDINYDHAIKFEFYSPVSGYAGFSLETRKNSVISLDLEAGFIGMNLGDYYFYDKFKGVFAGFGPRMYFKNEAQKATAHRSFDGVYIKPALTTNFYSFEVEDEMQKNITGSDFSISMIMVFGAQSVISERFVFDFWFGCGYSKSWQKISEDVIFTTYEYDFTHKHPGESPLIFDAGFSLGYIFK